MPTIKKTEHQPIVVETDIVIVRQVVRKAAIEQGLSLVDQTKLVTAASELARNNLEYGGGGEAIVEWVEEGLRRGVRATFIDHGPGIADIPQAMTDGFTSGGGMGHGLGGSKRLVQDFHIVSVVGSGTTVTIARWR